MSRCIYAIIEVKRDGVWHAYASPNVDYSPELESALFGDGIPDDIPIQELPVIHCGLPSDISIVGMDIYAHACRSYTPHNISWMLPEDIEKAQALMYRLDATVKRTGIDVFDFEYSVFSTYINGNAICTHTGWDSARIVYWMNK